MGCDTPTPEDNNKRSAKLSTTRRDSVLTAPLWRMDQKSRRERALQEEERRKRQRLHTEQVERKRRNSLVELIEDEDGHLREASQPTNTRFLLNPKSDFRKFPTEASFSESLRK